MAVDATEFDRARLWVFRAALVRVIDGDTVACLVDTGFGGRHEAHIRLAGINAPERWTPDGPAATERLVRALATGWAAPDPRWPLRVITEQQKTVVGEVQSFARYVGHLRVVQEDGSLVELREVLDAG